MITTDDKQPIIGAPPSARLARTRVLSEFEHLLHQAGCPACTYVAEAERSFFSWFEIESHTTQAMQARLRGAMGMCPAHSRRLVGQLEDGPIVNRVAREALAGARQALRGESRPSRCPACEAAAFAADYIGHLIADALADSGNVRAYAEHTGMCLPHVLDFASAADASVLKPVAERLAVSLGEERGPALELLAGADEDAGRRAKWQEHAPDAPRGTSTLDGLFARLLIDACPVCLSRGQAARRYSQWLAERNRAGDPSIQRDPGELCGSHLHDLAIADPAAMEVAAGRKRAARMGRLAKLLDRLAEQAPAPRRRRRSEHDLLARPRDEFASDPYCPACHACNGVERSQLELLGASLALPRVRDRYQQSHGLCVRHALELTDEAGQQARYHADACVGLLSWEVNETARKYAWASRHEDTGPERSGSLRALAQIDGRTFEGGPAR